MVPSFTPRQGYVYRLLCLIHIWRTPGAMLIPVLLLLLHQKMGMKCSTLMSSICCNLLHWFSPGRVGEKALTLDPPTSSVPPELPAHACPSKGSPDPAPQSSRKALPHVNIYWATRVPNGVPMRLWGKSPVTGIWGRRQVVSAGSKCRPLPFAAHARPSGLCFSERGTAECAHLLDPTCDLKRNPSRPCVPACGITVTQTL